MGEHKPQIDLTDPGNLRRVINQIRGHENISRKRNAQRKFDVYRNLQGKYILQKLRDEFDEESVRKMRKVLSVNVAKPMVDKMASLYTRPPEREFTNTNERQQQQIDNLYNQAQINTTMRLANKYFKLGDQCMLWVFPKNGIIKSRVLFPHMYDVVPDVNDPEKAHAVILNVWNQSMHEGPEGLDSLSGEFHQDFFENNEFNEQISDENDRQALLDRYVIWTPDFHFVSDGKGNIRGEIVPNPIGMLPFVDIAFEKDFQFFVENGSNLVEFTIDFGSQLSDLANITRLQNYSQAVIAAKEKPVDISVGPNKVLFLQIDPENPEATPSFQFVTPSPDLQGSLEILESQMKLFLSSLNIDTSSLIVRGGNDTEKFTSGIDRFLAMIKEFEASKEDMDLFRDVEKKAFKLMKAWSNQLQTAREPDGTPTLMEDLRLSTLPDDIDINIDFQEPESAVTEKDKLDNMQTRIEMNIMSRKEAIMEDRNVNEERAEEIMQELDQNGEETTPFAQGNEDGQG